MFGRLRNIPHVDLDQLITLFGRSASSWEAHPAADVLARAQLADACRDASVRPASEAAFQACWTDGDDLQRQRLCLLISSLELEPVAERLTAHCPQAEADPVLELLLGLAQRLHLLTLDVLEQSDIRLEEFARHFCAGWGLRIAGETADQSQARLHEIDFGRLMKEAEAARSSAEERLAYLRELQAREEQSRRPRRGKW